jgi:epoxide hydrolase
MTDAGPNPVPAGFSIFPAEAIQASRRWIERRYPELLHYEQLARGGHFAALEQPEVLTAQIRTTFRARR